MGGCAGKSISCKSPSATFGGYALNRKSSKRALTVARLDLAGGCSSVAFFLFLYIYSSGKKSAARSGEFTFPLCGWVLLWPLLYRYILERPQDPPAIGRTPIVHLQRSATPRIFDLYSASSRVPARVFRSRHFRDSLTSRFLFVFVCRHCSGYDPHALYCLETAQTGHTTPYKTFPSLLRKFGNTYLHSLSKIIGKIVTHFLLRSGTHEEGEGITCRVRWMALKLQNKCDCFVKYQTSPSGSYLCD